jgi:hypothetical protein
MTVGKSATLNRADAQHVLTSLPVLVATASETDGDAVKVSSGNAVVLCRAKTSPQ